MSGSLVSRSTDNDVKVISLVDDDDCNEIANERRGSQSDHRTRSPSISPASRARLDIPSVEGDSSLHLRHISSQQPSQPSTGGATPKTSSESDTEGAAPEGMDADNAPPAIQGMPPTSQLNYYLHSSLPRHGQAPIDYVKQSSSGGASRRARGPYLLSMEINETYAYLSRQQQQQGAAAGIQNPTNLCRSISWGDDLSDSSGAGTSFLQATCTSGLSSSNDLVLSNQQVNINTKSAASAGEHATASKRRTSVVSRQPSLLPSPRQRVLTNPSAIVPRPGCPYDNEHSHLVVHVGMKFCNGRFEALYELGTGGFGQVVLCRDHHASGRDVVVAPGPQSGSAGSSNSLNTMTMSRGGVDASGNLGTSPGSTSTLSQSSPTAATTGGARRNSVTHGSSSLVALKVMRSDSEEWAQLELDSLVHLQRLSHDPRAEATLVRYYGSFQEYGHRCFVFEHLKSSLLDVIEARGHKGLSFARIRELSKQLLTGLACLASNNVIHADVKPENVMICEQPYGPPHQRRRSTGGPAGLGSSISGVNHPILANPSSAGHGGRAWTSKLIDFGSCCSTDDQPYTYIQSRYYRAPEVIVGADYDNRIDSWAAGATIAEMFLGLPLFPGTSEFEQLHLFLERFGEHLPETVLRQGCRTAMYYNETTQKKGQGGETSSDNKELASAFELKSKKNFYEEQQVPEIPQQPKCYRYTGFSKIISHRACLVEDIQAALEDIRSGTAYERAQTRSILETGNVRSGFATTGVPPSYLSPSASAVDLRVSEVTASAKEQTRQVIDLIEYQRWQLADLLQGLLAVDPANRLTPEAALAHPFLNF